MLHLCIPLLPDMWRQSCFGLFVGFVYLFGLFFICFAIYRDHPFTREPISFRILLPQIPVSLQYLDAINFSLFYFSSS